MTTSPGPSYRTCESCHTRVAVGVATQYAAPVVHVCERCRPDPDFGWTFEPYFEVCGTCLAPHGGIECR